MQACHESAAAFGVGADGPVVWTSTCRAASSRSPTSPRWSPTACARAGCRRAACGSRSRRPCCWARRRPRGATSRTCARWASCSCSTTSAPATPRCATCRWRRSRSTARSSARSGRARGDTAIVSAIVSLARALGIDAIAEGVESEAQAAAAARARLRVGAGLSVRRPRSADNLRPVTTFEELDALSTRELHDRAVKRAERQLDVTFFWRLLQEGTAAEAADGVARARRGEIRALEPPGARGAAPRRRRARGAPSDLHRLSAGEHSE